MILQTVNIKIQMPPLNSIDESVQQLFDMRKEEKENHLQKMDEWMRAD